ncbi:hypothetical protein GmHk_11G032877 [Glycine max]|nr:hypothetical protein GmHk_11G032877 [Glycine max]
MGEVEEVKADTEILKEQMATMMEAMMSIKVIMEVNAVAIATTSTIVEVDMTPPYGLNQINHPTSDMVGLEGKELGGAGGPHLHAFPPYGLPPNYTPPNVAYTPNENANNSTPILIESQQPQSDHAHVSRPIGETHEMPHHNLADFEPCLGYATEGQAVRDIPLQNTLEGPQYHPQPHPLHSTAVKNLHAMEEMGMWRDLAAQVAPPMTKMEIITVIVDTLPVFYYEKMVGYTPSSFANLVFADEMI